MQAVDFLEFSAVGQGIEVKDDDYTKKVQFRYGEGWNDTHDSLLSQSIPEDLDEVSPKKIEKQIDDIIEDMFSQVEDLAPDLIENPRDNFYFRPRTNRPRLTFWSKDDCVIIPNPTRNGNVFIVTSNKDIGRDVRDRLVDNLLDIGQHLEVYGVEDLEITDGAEYAHQVITEIDGVTGVCEEEPNDLEKAVKEDLTSITETVLCSSRINFGEHSANPEYDILLPFGPDNILNIEVKDYQGRDKEPTEDEIINDPLNQARLLNINHVFSIAKGIDDEKRNNFENSVELRDDIDIIKKENVTEKVRQYIEDNLLYNLMWGR